MPDQLTSLRDALAAFVSAAQTQSQEHIRPLHAHIVERLVIEGGFRPEDLSPRPPLRYEEFVRRGRRRHVLSFDGTVVAGRDQTLLGGLKTKDVDVVVAHRRLGPCLAVSVKGTGNAFRNLTNRMEETAGDCTNLHLMYPALVYGFLHVMRANTTADAVQPNDVAIGPTGRVVESIVRYHDSMTRITGRKDIRNESSRYEAVGLALVVPSGEARGELLTTFPALGSALRFDQFFNTLYAAYDLRFVYSAPAVARQTARLEWSSESPVLEQARDAGFTVRVAAD